MAEPKTKRTTASVAAFLTSVENEQRRKDAKAVEKIFRDAVGEKPAMWGTAIVGYGSFKSNTGDWPLVAFSPRKASLVLYLVLGAKGAAPLLKKLGKHKVSGGCLHLNKLEDVNTDALRDLVVLSWEDMTTRHC